MKTSKQLLIATFLMGMFFTLAGCNDKEATTTKLTNKSWNLPVAKAEMVKKFVYYSSTGSVVTDQRIDVASASTGIVGKILVANGRRVTKGQTLVILRSSGENQKSIKIKSPTTGTIVARHKVVGDVASPRTAILTLNINKGFIFETFVTESRIGKIKVNEKVNVYIDALNTSIAGTVARVASSGDPLTRRYRVKIVLPEKNGLFPGMFGRSRFKTGSEKVLVIPKDALVERGGLKGSFVVDKENTLHFRWLRVGKSYQKNIEVLAGLEAGEYVVSVNEAHLRDGDAINSKGGNQ
ncbi:MAG: efflux RND transporter periplasmic adaptor subunit [Woeseiaceae bacterium]